MQTGRNRQAGWHVSETTECSAITSDLDARLSLQKSDKADCPDILGSAFFSKGPVAAHRRSQPSSKRIIV
jgi:hypothetical protein